ncbi:hypothetical protein AAVH_41895, partial [Aphelenchoides avenae]
GYISTATPIDDSDGHREPSRVGMHRLLLAFLLLCPCGFTALQSPRVCPGVRPLLADRYDKTL